MELVDGGLSQVEKRVFRDSAEHCGAREVSILNHTRSASDDEILASFLHPRLR